MNRISWPSRHAFRFNAVMDDLVKLVRTYRFSSGLDDRGRVGEQIIRAVASDLHLFVFTKVAPSGADDVFQETLKGIATGLRTFRGGTDGEFWAWCYRVARHKLADHFRKQAGDRLITTTPDDLQEMMDLSAQLNPVTPSVKHDLDYGMHLLTQSKPECKEFLWNHFVFGLDYAEIAEDKGMTYDNVRMKIGRCLEEVKTLVSRYG